MIKDILRGGQNYRDYLPYNHTEDLAKLLFQGGRPFTHLDQTFKSSLTRCLKVRNYIAHRSEHSKTQFLNHYKAIKLILQKNPRAIHYLDDHIRAGVTMFENDLSQLHAISKFLA